ncbi:hypothetical protein [Streptomyces sp. MAR4 CNX-425]|uniref:hypothetical protein n=1 Tax=Streptomyces sp. MAR4 CNX-425 TaxID=3406343 RepID=UPI003B50CFA4
MLRTVRRTAAAAFLAAAVTVTAAAPAGAAPVTWRDVSPEVADSVFHDMETAGGETWAVGLTYDTGMLPLAMRWNGTAWDAPAMPFSGPGRINDLAMAGPGDAWAVGEVFTDDFAGRALLQHWDGHAWAEVGVPLPKHTAASLSAVTVAGDGSVWVAGRYEINNYDDPVHFTQRRDTGGNWTKIPGGIDVGYVNALETAPDGSVYAAAFTDVYRSDGTGWTVEPMFTPAATVGFESVEVRATDDIWAVGFFRDGKLGRSPLAMHYDGTSWSRVSTPAETGQIFDVAFDAQGTPVAVGESLDPEISPEGHYVLTLDETGAFTRTESIPGAGNLYSAATDSRGRVWAAGVTSDAPAPFLPYAFAGIRG